MFLDVLLNETDRTFLLTNVLSIRTHPAQSQLHDRHPDWWQKDAQTAGKLTVLIRQNQVDLMILIHQIDQIKFIKLNSCDTLPYE